ncbi:enoyl-CoA hydratase/isomerase family protein [Olivibacter ginsenosidimutans]|uniref:Enoyl-CoA hydratase/isomerase family protein n=1 Tax=Olivibacter ginsenosidimutans TaxID=1176537 RepID=A0ABP9AZY1_9SPHI
MKKHHLDTGTVATTIDGKVAYITFSHPAHNALPSALLSRLAALIRRLGKTVTIKLIVLQSEGDRTFCAGANFDELLSIENAVEGKTFFNGFVHVINAIRLANQLVVGRIQGKAVGGAVGLAAACDYCFATIHAQIKLSELSIGIGPFVVAPVIQRKIGLSKLTELTLQPDVFKSAQWGLEAGLFQVVSQDIHTMDTLLKDFCERLVSYSPLALSEIKKMLWKGTADWDALLFNQAEISGKLVVDKKTKSLLKQFKTKKR